MNKEITVNVIYDDVANVYVGTSEDLIGLVAEAPTFEELVNKIRQLVPELVELNGVHPIARASEAKSSVPWELLIQQREQIYA